MDIINYRTKIIMGEDSLTFLNRYRDERVFIVADPFIVESGLIKLVTESFHESNTIKIFKEVVPDPPVEKVVAGMAEFMIFKGGIVLAIGGGSAIDQAKAITYFSRQLQEGAKPICIVLPTTSGAGSEVTSFAVITDQQKEIKYPLVSDQILPDVAILSAHLVAGVPPVVVADSGIDVLTHAIEAYVSTSATVFSDALAEKAFKLVFKYLTDSYKFGTTDLVAKANMHYASCMAGMAFNAASLGLNHGIAHSAGVQYHLPHGRINSLLLPGVIAFNAELDQPFHNDCKARQRYAELASSIGLKGIDNAESTRLLITAISHLQQSINLPQSLKDAGVSSQQIESSMSRLVTGALNDSCTETNPRQPKGQEIEQIIRGISGFN